MMASRDLSSRAFMMEMLCSVSIQRLLIRYVSNQDKQKLLNVNLFLYLSNHIFVQLVELPKWNIYPFHLLTYATDAAQPDCAIGALSLALFFNKFHQLLR